MPNQKQEPLVKMDVSSETVQVPMGALKVVTRGSVSNAKGSVYTIGAANEAGLRTIERDNPLPLNRGKIISLMLGWPMRGVLIGDDGSKRRLISSEVISITPLGLTPATIPLVV